MIYNIPECQSYVISGLNTVGVQVATGRGLLHTITINGVAAAGTIGLIDGLTGSTANLGTITTSNSNAVTLTYDIYFAAGLRITTSATPNVTISYLQG